MIPTTTHPPNTQNAEINGAIKYKMAIVTKSDAFVRLQSRFNNFITYTINTDDSTFPHAPYMGKNENPPDVIDARNKPRYIPTLPLQPNKYTNKTKNAELI